MDAQNKFIMLLLFYKVDGPSEDPHITISVCEMEAQHSHSAALINKWYYSAITTKQTSNQFKLNVLLHF